MVSKKIAQALAGSSVIRAMFNEGKEMAARYGAENVYDFSLGNPNVPAPESVKEVLADLIQKEDPVALHSYTSAQGDAKVRQAIAEYVNGQHGTSLTADNFYMTVGAAASLTISLKALAEPEDEFIVFSPFFPEYRVFVEGVGAKLVVAD